MHGLEQSLSIEIKKEIADRYFGFRKMIEEDISSYNSQLTASFNHLEDTIGKDLIRLYILLGNEDLIKKFFQLTGLHDDLFFDPYLLASKTIRKRLFREYRAHGLTKRQRFTRLFLEIYHELSQYIESYRFTLQKLVEEQETIAETIKLFYRKNDLSAIMGFFRSMDNQLSGDSTLAATGETLPDRDRQLADKMRVEPPSPADTVLPVIPQLKPYKKIKSQLITLIHQSFERQGNPDIRQIISQHS